MSWRAIAVLILSAFGLGAGLGDFLGERDMKHWQDIYYQAHPKVVVCIPCPTEKP